MEGRILYTTREAKLVKKVSKKRIWFLLALFGLKMFLIGGIYLLRLPYWQVEKIEVGGLEVIDYQDIKTRVDEFLSRKILFLLPQSSFLLLDSRRLAAILQREFPRIESLLVKKIFPDSLVVFLKERELFGVFCNDGCVYIDKQGFAYDFAPSSFGSLLVKIKSDAAEVHVGTTLLEQNLMDDFILLSAELEKAAGVRPVAYEFLSKVSSEIKVETSEGFKIFFKRSGNFNNSFGVLKTVLEQEIKNKRPQLEYIDLRFGNKVFYKFKR